VQRSNNIFFVALHKALSAWLAAIASFAICFLGLFTANHASSTVFKYAGAFDRTALVIGGLLPQTATSFLSSASKPTLPRQSKRRPIILVSNFVGIKQHLQRIAERCQGLLVFA